MGQLINQLDFKAYVNDKTNNSLLIVHALTTYNILFKDCVTSALANNSYRELFLMNRTLCGLLKTTSVFALALQISKEWVG